MKLWFMRDYRVDVWYVGVGWMPYPAPQLRLYRRYRSASRVAAEALSDPKIYQRLRLGLHPMRPGAIRIVTGDFSSAGPRLTTKWGQAITTFWLEAQGTSSSDWRPVPWGDLNTHAHCLRSEAWARYRADRDAPELLKRGATEVRVVAVSGTNAERAVVWSSRGTHPLADAFPPDQN